MTRRRVIRLVAGAVAVFIVVTMFSAGRYVLANSGDPVQQSLASWARNKGLGGIVDQLEAWLHNDPPAVAPADTLALVPVDTEPPATTVAPGTTVSTGTVAPGPTTTLPVTSPTGAARQTNRVRTTSCPNVGTTTTVATTTTVENTTTTVPPTTTTTTSSTLPGETTTTTTTTTTLPARPTDIAPQVAPQLRGEGEWVVIARARSKPAIFATSMRPLWCYGSVVATMATYDPNKVRAALFNGTEVPGGRGWRKLMQAKILSKPSSGSGNH